MGSLTNSTESEHLKVTTDKSYADLLKSDGEVLVNSLGSSMEPFVRNRSDVLLIRSCPAEQMERFDVPMFVRTDGHFVVHRILKIRSDGSFLTAGDHCTYTETVPAERVIGVLDSIIRDGKTLPARYRDLSFFGKLGVRMRCGMFHPVHVFFLKCVRKMKRFLRNR